MRLHLVRHGEARPGLDDSARPLTQKGRDDVARLADLAAAAGVAPAEIRHSGLVRARETAEILARRLAPRRGLVVTRGLTPDDDPADVAIEAGVLTEPLLVVTHMPFVARLTGLLTGSRSGALVEPYATAELRTLDRDGAVWHVTGRIHGDAAC